MSGLLLKGARLGVTPYAIDRKLTFAKLIWTDTDEADHPSTGWALSETCLHLGLLVVIRTLPCLSLVLVLLLICSNVHCSVWNRIAQGRLTKVTATCGLWVQWFSRISILFTSFRLFCLFPFYVYHRYMQQTALAACVWNRLHVSTIVLDFIWIELLELVKYLLNIFWVILFYELPVSCW